MYLDSVNWSEGYGSMRQMVSLDPEDSKAMIAGLFRQMFPPEQLTEIEDALAVSVYEITDDNRYAYYFYPGIPVFIEASRLTTIRFPVLNGTQREVVRIELLEE